MLISSSKALIKAVQAIHEDYFGFSFINWFDSVYQGAQ